MEAKVPSLRRCSTVLRFGDFLPVRLLPQEARRRREHADLLQPCRAHAGSAAQARGSPRHPFGVQTGGPVPAAASCGGNARAKSISPVLRAFAVSCHCHYPPVRGAAGNIEVPLYYPLASGVHHTSRVSPLRPWHTARGGRVRLHATVLPSTPARLPRCSWCSICRRVRCSASTRASRTCARSTRLRSPPPT